MRFLRPQRPDNMPMQHITPYERPYREHVLNLLYDSHRLHKHLDWQRPLQWLESDGGHHIRLIWQGDVLMGIMGISAPLYAKSWVRLLAFSTAADIPTLLPALWQDVLPDVQAHGADEVYVLVIDAWLERFLPLLGFAYVEEVVTLHRMSQRLPIAPLTKTTSLELAYLEDADAILRVDNEAFTPPWQMTRDEIRLALRHAASSVIAKHDGRVIGYQISTRHQKNGHLARLAVHPSAQGRGVGAQLMDYLVHYFARRHIHSITVNTQQSNWRSQRLYQRYGFRRNGFDLSVWRIGLM
jgi:ribosomal-protein-alanine N-acetyltransferase